MLVDELKKAQMEALKTKDTLKRSVLQIVTGKVKLAEIEKRTKNETLTDDDVLLVINKVIKELNPNGEKEGDTFVSCKSHTFLRGTNIDSRTILIIDEAQNFYFDELKKVLTRVKDGTKVIVMGHDGQCDILKNRECSGFVPYLNWFKGREGVAVCSLTENHRGWVSRIADEFQFNPKRQIEKKETKETENVTSPEIHMGE